MIINVFRQPLTCHAFKRFDVALIVERISKRFTSTNCRLDLIRFGKVKERKIINVFCQPLTCHAIKRFDVALIVERFSKRFTSTN